MIKYLHLLLLLVITSSCNKSKSEPEINATIKSFTFGEGVGYTIADDDPYVTTQYTLKDDQLVQIYYKETGKKESPLNAEKTKIALELKKTTIPEYLFTLPQKRYLFGCNACANIKNYYVHIQIGNDKYYWSFDQNIEELEPELREYVIKVKEIITRIKN
jgi:hypothetical protein